MANSHSAIWAEALREIRGTARPYLYMDPTQRAAYEVDIEHRAKFDTHEGRIAARIVAKRVALILDVTERT